MQLQCHELFHLLLLNFPQHYHATLDPHQACGDRCIIINWNFKCYFCQQYACLRHSFIDAIHQTNMTVGIKLPGNYMLCPDFFTLLRFAFVQSTSKNFKFVGMLCFRSSRENNMKTKHRQKCICIAHDYTVRSHSNASLLRCWRL